LYVGTDEHGATSRQHQEQQDGGNRAHLKNSHLNKINNQHLIAIISSISHRRIASRETWFDRNSSRFGETVSYNTACATALIIPELIDTYNDNTAGRTGCHAGHPDR
jgi:hypothetical protein